MWETEEGRRRRRGNYIEEGAGKERVFSHTGDFPDRSRKEKKRKLQLGGKRGEAIPPPPATPAADPNRYNGNWILSLLFIPLFSINHRPLFSREIFGLFFSTFCGGVSTFRNAEKPHWEGEENHFPRKEKVRNERREKERREREKEKQ